MRVVYLTRVGPKKTVIIIFYYFCPSDWDQSGWSIWPRLGHSWLKVCTTLFPVVLSPLRLHLPTALRGGIWSGLFHMLEASVEETRNFLSPLHCKRVGTFILNLTLYWFPFSNKHAEIHICLLLCLNEFFCKVMMFLNVHAFMCKHADILVYALVRTVTVKGKKKKYAQVLVVFFFWLKTKIRYHYGLKKTEKAF